MEEFGKVIDEEKKRHALELEKQKVKIDELIEKVNTLRGEKDEKDQEIGALNEESKKQLSEIESMSNRLSHIDKYKALRIVFLMNLK